MSNDNFNKVIGNRLGNLYRTITVIVNNFVEDGQGISDCGNLLGLCVKNMEELGIVNISPCLFKWGSKIKDIILI